jgi:SAM-dependent methyltransferase
MKHDLIVHMVTEYYSKKIKQFGPVPGGVDWNGAESQNLRFDQLIKLVPEGNARFSLLDYGCGYAALLQYLRDRLIKVDYTGYDISREMINSAVGKANSPEVTLTSSTDELSRYDYVLASGIFNVKEQISHGEWEQYVLDTLAHMNMLSIRGFAFNVLSDFSDPEKRKDNLYYASPGTLFDYCKNHFSKSVALLHDYPLFEFTILVRKDVV